jgi:sirohydrochlorin cobaltochelatase
MVDMHAGLLKKKGYDVFTAFNEMTDPMIEDAMTSIVKEGYDKIVALPLFVASGRHTIHDIPPKLGIPDGYGCSTSTKFGRKITIDYNEPFGDDPGVTQVLIQKLREIKFSDETGVLLVAHGSPLKHNSELVNRTAERLKASGIQNVLVGFNEYNEPSIEDSYNDLIEAGFNKIIVLPMFLASGGHIGEEIPEKLGIPAGSKGGTINAGGRSINVFYAETLGLNPDMNEILITKIKNSTVS